MSFLNPCRECIGKTGQGEDCCINVYIILNPEEIHLFIDKAGFTKLTDHEGGLYYTETGCPYLGNDNQCTIHTLKPLYCKYYPIFITGDPFIDLECPAHSSKQFSLSKKRVNEIRKLQKKFPIYQQDWPLLDVRELFSQS